MVAITVTSRVDFPYPGYEVITATPATTGDTYVSKLGTVTGVFFGSASMAAADAISAQISSKNTITFTVIGTARLQTIMIVGYG